MSGEGMNNQSGINLKIDAYMRANPAAVKGKSRQQIISIMLQSGQLTAAEVSQLSGMLSGEMADTADMGWTIERESLQPETNHTEKQTLPPAPQTQPANTIRIEPITTGNNPFGDGADIDAIMADFPIMGDTFETSSTPTPATPVASPAQPEPQVAPESATTATTTPAPSEPAPTPVTEATPATEPQVAQEASTPTVAPMTEEPQAPQSTLSERDGHAILECPNGGIIDINEAIRARIDRMPDTLREIKGTERYRDVIWDNETITNLRMLHQQEQNRIKGFDEHPEKRAQLFKMLTGAEYTPENVEKFLNGEIKLKSEQRIEEYVRDEKAREEALIPSWIQVGTSRRQILDQSSPLGYAFSVADRNHDGVLGEDEMPRFREEVIRGKKAQAERKAERKAEARRQAQNFYNVAANSTRGTISTNGMKEVLSNIDASTICDFLTAYNNIEVRKGDSSIIDTIFSEWGMNKAQRQEVMNIILKKLCEAAENVGVDPAEIKQAREAFQSYDKKTIEDALHRLHGKTVALQTGNEQILTERGEKAVADAREFYRIADDNSGSLSIPTMRRHVEKNITPENICDFLDGYDSTNVRQQDSSVIDTIMSEFMRRPEETKPLLDMLMDKLTQAARNSGVSEGDIEEARRAFGSYKTEDMERAMRLLRGSILAKKVPNPTELTAEQAISTFAGIAGGDIDSAEESFVDARINEGWAAATGDTVCGWFGCTTVEEMEQKLGVHAAEIKALCECKTEADFRAKYKEIFGIDFDVEKIAARELAVSNYQQAQMLSKSLESINEILIRYPNASLNDLKAHMQNNLGYDKTTIERMYLDYAEAHGIEIKTDEDRRDILMQVLREAAQGTKESILQLTDGKSFERMQTDIELLTKSAFGTKDIVKDVMTFNENMMMTEMVTLGIAEIAGTIALQFVPGLGQIAMARLAASAARFGTRAVKVANALEKTAALGVRIQSGQTLKGANGLAKVVNRGFQVATSMANAGAATAGIHISNGEELKDAMKKALLNMSFAGVGATSSILSPKLMQMFNLDSRVATELSEELINVIGSYGVSSIAEMDYAEQDALLDIVTGLVIARVSHVKGAGHAADTPSAALPSTPDMKTIQGTIQRIQSRNIRAQFKSATPSDTILLANLSDEAYSSFVSAYNSSKNPIYMTALRALSQKQGPHTVINEDALNTILKIPTEELSNLKPEDLQLFSNFNKDDLAAFTALTQKDNMSGKSLEVAKRINEFKNKGCSLSKIMERGLLDNPRIDNDDIAHLAVLSDEQFAKYAALTNNPCPEYSAAFVGILHACSRVENGKIVVDETRLSKFHDLIIGKLEELKYNTAPQNSNIKAKTIYNLINKLSSEQDMEHFVKALDTIKNEDSFDNLINLICNGPNGRLKTYAELIDEHPNTDIYTVTALLELGAQKEEIVRWLDLKISDDELTSLYNNQLNGNARLEALKAKQAGADLANPDVIAGIRQGFSGEVVAKAVKGGLAIDDNIKAYLAEGIKIDDIVALHRAKIPIDDEVKTLLQQGRSGKAIAIYTRARQYGLSTIDKETTLNLAEWGLTPRKIHTFDTIKSSGLDLSDKLLADLLLADADYKQIYMLSFMLSGLKDSNLNIEEERLIDLVKRGFNEDEITQAASIVNSPDYNLTYEQIIEIHEANNSNESVDIPAFLKITDDAAQIKYFAQHKITPSDLKPLLDNGLSCSEIHKYMQMSYSLEHIAKVQELRASGINVDEALLVKLSQYYISPDSLETITRMMDEGIALDTNTLVALTQEGLDSYTIRNLATLQSKNFGLSLFDMKILANKCLTAESMIKVVKQIRALKLPISSDTVALASFDFSTKELQQLLSRQLGVQAINKLISMGDSPTEILSYMEKGVSPYGISVYIQAKSNNLNLPDNELIEYVKKNYEFNEIETLCRLKDKGQLPFSEEECISLVREGYPEEKIQLISELKGNTEIPLAKNEIDALVKLNCDSKIAIETARKLRDNNIEINEHTIELDRLGFTPTEIKDIWLRHNAGKLDLEEVKAERFAQNLSTKIDTALEVMKPEDVQRIIDNIAHENGISQEEASKILARLTQFSNYQSLPELRAALDAAGIGRLDGLHFVSTNAALSYVGHTKGQFDSSPCDLTKPAGLILDEGTLQYLENLKTTDPHRFRTIQEEILRGHTKLIAIDGWNIKIGDKSYSCSLFDGGSDLEHVATQVIRQMQKTGDSLDTVLMGDFRSRVDNILGKTADGKEIPITRIQHTNLQNRDTSAAAIARSLAPTSTDAATIRSTIDVLTNRAVGHNASPEERRLVRNMLNDYFESMCVVHSPSSTTRVLREQHARLETYLKAHKKDMKDVIFVIPRAEKSFSVVAEQYARANGIDRSQFIFFDGSDNIDMDMFEGKAVVILDDIVGSGNSMVRQQFKYQDFASNLDSGVIVDCNVIFAPIVSLRSGVDYIEDTISMVSRSDYDACIPAHIVDFEKTRDRINLTYQHPIYTLEKVLGALGYDRGGACTALQYMIPDNNAAASGLFLRPFLVNGVANKRDDYIGKFYGDVQRLAEMYRQKPPSYPTTN